MIVNQIARLIVSRAFVHYDTSRDLLHLVVFLLMYFLPQSLHSWSVQLADAEHESREVLSGVWPGALAGFLAEAVDEVERISDSLLVGLRLGMSVLQRNSPESLWKTN